MKWWLFQDDKRNQLAEWGVFLFLGIFLLYFKLNYHEMWKDEWQAWLVARDMSWAEMLGFLYYEGHPALWYVYLKVWTYARSTLSDDLLLQLAHSLPVLAAYALLLFRFSFSIWLKVAVALSYYLFFEYGMVSRGYVFVVFLGFWLALALKNPRKNAPLIALLLLLLCQTEVYGLLIASSLLVYLFFREWLPERPQFTGLIKKREILLPATGALLGFILFLVSVLPLGRSTEGYERKSELFAQLNGDGNGRAVKFCKDTEKAYISAKQNLDMSLSECFSGITDPRRKQGIRVKLDQLLTMTVLSYLCGHFGYRGVARFCKANSSFFCEELNLLHGVPSHVTFYTVLSQLDSRALIEGFQKWVNSHAALQNTDWVSVDGKTLGGTVKDTQGSGQDFEGVVSLYCHQSGLVHAIEHYRRKSKEKGEAPLARQLMTALKDKGVVFTMDALHSQKNDKNNR
jgi:hypothetical protein